MSRAKSRVASRPAAAARLAVALVGATWLAVGAGCGGAASGRRARASRGRAATVREAARAEPARAPAPARFDRVEAASPCFAWSSRTGRTLCAVGRWGNVPGELRLEVGEIPGGPVLGVLESEADGGEEAEARSAPLPEATRAALRARVRAGGFEPMTGACEVMDVSRRSATFGSDARLRLESRLTSPGADNEAPRYTHRIEVRFGARGSYLPVGGPEDAPVEAPNVRVCAMPGGRHAVIIGTWEFADEGDYHTEVEVWVCDRRAAVCGDLHGAR